MPEEDKIWYFAYGSNMRSSVMAGRGIIPSAVENVVVPTHILTFDVFGVPYSEPAMASIFKPPQPAIVRHEQAMDSNAATVTVQPPVHGVAYLLSHRNYRSLVVSEGAGIAYRETEVDAYRIYGQSKIVVRTLVARYPFRPNAAPSVRYLVSYNARIFSNSAFSYRLYRFSSREKVKEPFISARWTEMLRLALNIFVGAPSARCGRARPSNAISRISKIAFNLYIRRLQQTPDCWRKDISCLLDAADCSSYALDQAPG